MVFGIMNSVSYRQEDGAVIPYASAKSDSVVSPVTGKVYTSATFLYQWVKGDFVLRAKVSQRLLSTYDVPALMAMESEIRWARVCLEYTDPHTRAVVSVITGTTSDDYSGVETDSDPIWLQLCRKNHIFTIHYSLGGVHWRMYHILRMEMEEELKVDLAA